MELTGKVGEEAKRALEDANNLTKSVLIKRVICECGVRVEHQKKCSVLVKCQTRYRGTKKRRRSEGGGE